MNRLSVTAATLAGAALLAVAGSELRSQTAWDSRLEGVPTKVYVGPDTNLGVRVYGLQKKADPSEGTPCNDVFVYSEPGDIGEQAHRNFLSLVMAAYLGKRQLRIFARKGKNGLCRFQSGFIYD